MIKTDEKRYKQILFNLLGNAVKFTFYGGISAFVTIKNRKLVTSVKDTGIGINSEDI